MRRWLLSLACAAVSFGVGAQVRAPDQVPTQRSYAFLTVANDALVLVGRPEKPATGSKVGLESFRFLKVSEDFETDPLDMIVTYGEYDCAQPRRWRGLLERGFRQNQDQHVYREAVPSAWAIAAAGSAQAAVWEAACKPGRLAGASYTEWDAEEVAPRERVLTFYRTTGRAPAQ